MKKNFIRHYTDLGVTGSTNTVLKEKIYSSPLPVYDVFCADSQTGGRGRLGRSFYSPPGGAYFSAAYPLTGSEKNIPLFTLLAGTALTRSVRELTGVQALIKWPNDLYINGKKLAGILTELVSANGRTTVILGAGVNLTVTDIPEELSRKMTSFTAEGLPCPDRETLIRRTVEILDGLVYDDGLLTRSADGIITELNAKSFLYGKEISYNGRTGICGTVNPDGSVNILFGEKEEKIFTGELLPISDFRSPV